MECERHLAPHEGPQTPRKYQFTAREIAAALMRVGEGATYRSAARDARRKARRFRANPETGEIRETDHGQLVGDWVELFAPVVFAPYAPTAWPDEGTVVLDHLPFRVRAYRADGRPIPGGVVAFDVFCAMGYQAGRPRLWRLEGFADAGEPNWRAFLRSLPGAPPRIVCDNHSGMVRAVRGAWPDADLYFCEWHLRKALDRLLDKHRKPKADCEAAMALKARTEAAFTGKSFFRPFADDARAAGLPRVTRWLDEWQPILEAQYDRRGFRSTRPVNMPLTTGGLEAISRPIRDALHPRRYGLKNRERLNRLLMLVQLDANGQASERDYAKQIRLWLEANGGRPAATRRAVADRRGAPSLRARRRISAL